MNLTAENYFSVEANMYYMGATQYKQFLECEAMALATAKGEYKEEETNSMLVGSYVDAYYDGSLEKFKAEHKSIFTTKGELKSEFKKAEYIIERIEKDLFFKKYMSGESQVIKTGIISQVPFKIKIDSYHPDKVIVDLKVMKDFQPIWKSGLRLNFIEAWGYDLQGAIYQAVEGNSLPFYIAGVTKETEPDLAIISIPNERLDYCLDQIKTNVQRFDSIKKGLIEPTRCEKCDYCKQTKVLTSVIDWESL